MLVLNLNQLNQLQNLAGAQSWYSFNFHDAFNAGFNPADLNSGGCNGGDKQAQFLQAPFVQSTSDSIMVDNTGAPNEACIYQDT